MCHALATYHYDVSRIRWLKQSENHCWNVFMTKKRLSTVESYRIANPHQSINYILSNISTG